jgi:hypothetical protein
LKVSKIRGRNAFSTVISTVILVTVTIALAFIVAYWITGITEHYIKFEKVEIQSGFCIWDSDATYWKITLKLKNTGTATTTLEGVSINDAEVANYDLDSAVVNSTSTNMTASTSLESGASVTINVYIDQGYASLSACTTVNVKIICADGMEFIKTIELV